MNIFKVCLFLVPLIFRIQTQFSFFWSSSILPGLSTQSGLEEDWFVPLDACQRVSTLSAISSGNGPVNQRASLVVFSSIQEVVDKAGKCLLWHSGVTSLSAKTTV